MHRNWAILHLLELKRTISLHTGESNISWLQLFSLHTKFFGHVFSWWFLSRHFVQVSSTLAGKWPIYSSFRNVNNHGIDPISRLLFLKIWVHNTINYKFSLYATITESLTKIYTIINNWDKFLKHGYFQKWQIPPFQWNGEAQNF